MKKVKVNKLYYLLCSAQPKKWTVSSDWVGTEEGWGGFDAILPRAGQDVQIPASWWMVYDAQMEGLGNVS